MQNAISKLIACGVICAFSIAALLPAFHSPGQPMDEGMVLLYPEMFLKAHLPYRDFEMIYGPGNLFSLSAAYAVFGTNVFVERAVGLIYRLLILLAMFGIVQRWGTLIASGCAFVMAVLLTNTDLWANTWIAGIAFGLCALWLMANLDSAWRPLAAGFFAGFSLLCRSDFGFALIAAVLPLFFLMNRNAKKRFVIGTALSLSPLVLLAVLVGPAQLVSSLFLVPVFQIGPAGYLPMSAADADVRWLFYLHIGASALNLAAAFVTLRDTKPECARLLLGIALFGLGLTHYALSRSDSGHVLNVALISVSLLPLSVFVLASALKKKFPAWLISTVAIFVALAAIHFLVPTFNRSFYRGFCLTFKLAPARRPDASGEIRPGDRAIFVKHNGRSFPLGFISDAVAAEKSLTELERVSSPGQRLFVGPRDLRRTTYCDTYVYHLLPQLQPATYFLQMNPGSNNGPDSRLARDIASADWLLLNRRWDFINEPNKSSQFDSDALNEIVRRNFDFWFETGSYQLFRSKMLANAVVPPPA